MILSRTFRPFVLVLTVALVTLLLPAGAGATPSRTHAIPIATTGRVALAADPSLAPSTDPIPDSSPAPLPTAAVAPSPADSSFSWVAPTVGSGSGVNRVSAGGLKEIRFTLGGDRGLGILALGYPVSQRYDCATGVLVPRTRFATRPFRRAGLTFDPATATYSYTWRTREEWSNTCRRFTIQLVDGTRQSADVRFELFRFLAPSARYRLNHAVPGAEVPVRFRLRKNARLRIFSRSTPSSRQADCRTWEPLGEWAPTLPAGTAGLIRDPLRPDYQYAWQTSPDWAQTCRLFQMRMKDGSVQQLRFRFNRRPKAVDDVGVGFATDEATAFTTASVLANDSDPDGDPLTVSALRTDGLQGTLTDNGGGTFGYDPAGAFESLGQGESATTAFRYTIADPVGATDSAWVTIAIAGLNDAPTMTDQARSVPASAADGDAVGAPIAFDPVDANDVHTFAIVGGNTGGAFAIDAATGQIRVADATHLDPAAHATYALVVQVTDDASPSASDTATVTISVMDNAPPVAADHTLATSSGIRVTIGSGSPERLKAGATDADDPASDLSVSGTFANITPAGATVTLTDGATGAYTFDPPAGYSGPASFDYQVCDDGLPVAPQRCDTGTVTVTIAGPDLWFVDDSAAPGGTGRLSAPLQSLADLPPGRGSGDRIFVASGTYGTGHVFLQGERLIGQGATGAFDALLGVTVPAEGTLDARPALSGAPPVLGGTVTLESGARLRGVVIGSGAAPGLVDPGPAITGVAVSETSVTTTTGDALTLSLVAGSIELSDLDKNGAGSGIVLTEVDASVTVAAGATISGTTTGAVDIDGGTGEFSYAGTIDVSSGRAVQVTDRDTGTVETVTFSGAISATGGTGIDLRDNDNGTVRFTGGLSLSTGANTAFSATGGGTLAVTQDNASIVNTLTTTTASALVVTDTTIGAAGLTFRSISVNGADTGIVLDGTGGTAGLTVTGQGTTDGSGGTIRSTVTRGASFIGTSAVSLKNMTFIDAVTSDGPATAGDLLAGANTGDHAAIHLRTVDGATLDNLTISGSQEHGINAHEVRNLIVRDSVISGIGQSAGEDGIHAFNLKGPLTAITDTSITGSGGSNVEIANNTSLAGSFPATGTISVTRATLDGAAGDSGIRLDVLGTNSTRLDIDRSTLADNASYGVIAQGRDGSTLAVDIDRSTVRGNQRGIAITGESGDVRFDIQANTAIRLHDEAAIAITKVAGASGVLQGRIRDNADIDVAATVNAAAIEVENQAGGTIKVAITNNLIDYAGSSAAIDLATGRSGPGEVHASVKGNGIALTFDPLDVPGGPKAALVGVSGEETPGGDSAVLCANIGGPGVLRNTVTDVGGSTSADIVLHQRWGNTVQLPEYVGSPTSTTDVEAYLAGRNTLATAPLVTRMTGAFGGLATGCAQPVL